MTRVLVTGAAGFIGSHLVEALARRGDQVVGVDNFDGFYPRAMKERNLRDMGRLPGFAFHEQDMRDVEALRARLTPETVIVHLAARAGVRPSLSDPLGYAEMNVVGTAAVLEAARRAGVSRIAFGSSSSVYGDSTPVPFREDAAAGEPMSPYAATKRAGELLLRSVAPIYGFRSAALRFFTVYGPRQRPEMAFASFIRAVLSGKPLHVLGDGRQTRDFTYVTDVVSATIAAAERLTGPVYNVSGGTSSTLLEAIAQIERLTGRRALIRFSPRARGDAYRTMADLTAARRDLAYSPEVTLGQGLALQVRAAMRDAEELAEAVA